MKRGIRVLESEAKNSARYSERHFRLLGLLAGLIPLAYAVDYLVGQPHFDTFWIRLSAFVAALPLVFYERAVPQFRPWFHVYFVTAATYSLPLAFGLMLVLNAASAPAGSTIEVLWILQYFVSLFLFIQLIHSGLLATLLWIASILIAFSSLMFLESINWSELRRVILYPVTGYLTAIFVGILTNRNVDYVNSEKLKAASAIGSNIAHELRTPLASIRALARAVGRHSQVLVDTYARAREAELHSGDLTQAQIDGLREAMRSIEQEVAYSNTIIDMLLLNTSDGLNGCSDAAVFSASDCVHEALDRYPFNNSRERSSVTVRLVQDFQINASRILIVHVLFNLLKNGVYYAQKSANGSVEIVIGIQPRCIEITDTGPGIPISIRRRIFDRFYTSSRSAQGAGIGLSFCQAVLTSLGGDIQCESQEGSYTTFRLKFPPVRMARAI